MPAKLKDWSSKASVLYKYRKVSTMLTSVCMWGTLADDSLLGRAAAFPRDSPTAEQEEAVERGGGENFLLTARGRLFYG